MAQLPFPPGQSTPPGFLAVRQQEEDRLRLLQQQEFERITSRSGTLMPTGVPQMPGFPQETVGALRGAGGASYKTPEEMMQETSSGFLERAGRFITSVLSPLQLPQDILFASLAGAMDRERSVMDYFGEMEWGNYTPWSVAPKRVVSGSDLLMLANVQDEKTRQIVGLGMDFLLDPLMGGLVLRGVARAARAPGLNKIADIVDTVSEAPMALAGLPTVRVVNAARQLPGFRQVETQVVGGMVDNFIKPVLDAALRPAGGLEAVTQRTMFRVGSQEFSLAGMLKVDGGRMAGAQPVTARAGALAGEIDEMVGVLAMSADAAAGGTMWKGMLANLQRGMSVMYDIPVRQLQELPAELTQAIFTSAYATVSDVGQVALRQSGIVPSVRTASGGAGGRSPEMRRILQDIEQEIGETMGRTALRPEQARELKGRIDYFTGERQRIVDMANRYGKNGDQVGFMYDEVVNRLAQASAITGYFGSGYAPLRDRFFQGTANRLAEISARNPAVADAIKKAGGEAKVVKEAWHDLLRSGPRGYANQMLDYKVRFPGANVAGDAGEFTYRQMFGELAEVPGLDLGTYLDSLTRGHMRRTFGVFQDEGSWMAAVDRIKDGRLASSRILNEPVVYQAAAGAGFKKEADMLKRYLDDAIPKMYGNRPTGAFVRQEDFLEHMVRQGVEPARAQQFWRTVHQAQDPEIAALARRLEEYGRVHGGTIDPSQVLSQQRQNLRQPELETLIELMNPMLSTAETTRAALSSGRRTQAMAGLMDLAQQQGLVKTAAQAVTDGTPRWWVNIDETRAVGPLAGLAGKVVHPVVYRELSNALRLGKNDNGSWLGNLRSVLTAGYLASPATTAANVAGGFWTAMNYGINPVKLLNNMTEVYRDWKRLGRDLPELAYTRDIAEGALTQTDLIRMSRDLPGGVVNDLKPGIQGLSDAMREGAIAYQNFLRRPLGNRASGALGLGMFEATESLFRLGTFRMVMKETGGNIAEARKMARFVVFDYSAQPGIVQLARNSGLFLFPAFPYFMVGRTLTAARNRPYQLAAVERMPEAISQLVVPDEDERTRMLMGMEDWMREDKYIPIRRKENGDITMLSLNQLLPTNTMTGAPFADSLRSAGLWGPLIDMVSAFTQISTSDRPGDAGRGPFTGPYGRRVLPSGVDDFTDPQSVLQGFATFAMNSFAPAIVRKMIRPAEEADRLAEGLVPQLLRATQDIPAEWASTARTARELSSQRVDQDIFDAAVSFGIRSTRNVATQGLVADGPRILQRATNQLQREITGIDRRIQLLTAEGKTEAALRQQAIRDRLLMRYYERWGDYIEELRRMTAQGVFNPPPAMR